MTPPRAPIAPPSPRSQEGVSSYTAPAFWLRGKRLKTWKCRLSAAQQAARRRCSPLKRHRLESCTAGRSGRLLQRVEREACSVRGKFQIGLGNTSLRIVSPDSLTGFLRLNTPVPVSRVEIDDNENPTVDRGQKVAPSFLTFLTSLAFDQGFPMLT